MRRIHSLLSSPTTSRRGFLKLAGGVGAGLTLSLHSRASESSAELGPEGELNANAFVRISPDNTVTVVMKHLEMGQGSYTGLATLVAEELDADWQQVAVEGAPADAKRYNNLHWGPMQGTGGSSAIANAFMQMRTAGATARAMLVAAAAEKWQVKRRDISISNGVISHPSGRSSQFGELVALAAKQAVPAADSVTLKTPDQFVYIGKQQLQRKDSGKENGTAIYTQDIQLDGMLTAVVAHPPRFGAKLASVDASKAKASPNVVDVVSLNSGVAVVAKDFWSAKKARDLLQIEWDESQAYRGNSEQMFQEYSELANKTGLPAKVTGDAPTVLSTAAKTFEAEYRFPYLAHAAMEPMNCIAQVTEQGCEIWNAEQMQTVTQGTVAAMLGLPPEKVKINMLLAGGSFGRRANPHADFIVETVAIAKALPGTPIKLVWTREDDMRAGYYRPAYVHKLRASLDEQGNISAWQQHIVGQSILKGTPFEAFMVKDGIDATSVEGAWNLPYQVDNLQVELTTTESPVPVLWWRSVGHTHTAFSTETFLDQLAEQAGKDPVAMRMQMLEGHPRWQGVLKLAADKAGWGAELPEGWGRGVAVHESFNSYVAQVAEVSTQPDGSFKVERVVCAVDCGIAVNPDVIRAQMEGGIGFGLSAALMSQIDFADGQVVQSNFHDYQVLRNHQMPKVEVHIVASAEPPTGVGEPGTPPVAAAVANALAAATGKRHTQLPIKGA